MLSFGKDRWQAAGRKRDPLLAHWQSEEDPHRASTPHWYPWKDVERTKKIWLCRPHLVSRSPEWHWSKRLLCGTWGWGGPQRPHREQGDQLSLWHKQHWRRVSSATDKRFSRLVLTGDGSEVERGKNEWRNAVKLLALAAKRTGPGT